MRLLQALRCHAASISHRIAESNLFTHMGDRGSFREAIIRQFLRPFLPECYGLSSGEVFASDGTQSAQVDIVIFDAVFSTVLFRDGPHQLFPAESIFGSIEVKSNLTMPELSAACANVASVKSLTRAATDMVDLLPSVRLNLGPELTCDQTQRNPYIGLVFGYRGIAPETVTNELNRRRAEDPARAQLLPDAVFVADPGYMICRCSATPSKTTVVGPGFHFDKFMYLATTADTLPLFFVTLNLCLQQLRLRSVDYMAVWSQLMAEIIGREPLHPA